MLFDPENKDVVKDYRRIVGEPLLTPVAFENLHPPLVLALLHQSLRHCEQPMPASTFLDGEGEPFGYAIQLGLADLIATARTAEHVEAVHAIIEWLRETMVFTEHLEPVLAARLDPDVTAAVSNEATGILYHPEVLPVLMSLWGMDRQQWAQWEQLASADQAALSSLVYLRDEYKVTITGAGEYLRVLHRDSEEKMKELAEKFLPRTRKGETQVKTLLKNVFEAAYPAPDLDDAVVVAEPSDSAATV